MRNKLYKTVRKKEAGVAIPEFMISFPVLLILLLGSIDLGSLLQQYLLVQHAAAIGAEKIQTLPSLTNVPTCSTNNTSIVSSQDESINQVINKMNSVLETSKNQMTTKYMLCKKTAGSKQYIQIQASATYDQKLFQMKSASLTAKVEVPYFFGG
jgi:Flp pilus assembly protein TadG